MRRSITGHIDTNVFKAAELGMAGIVLSIIFENHIPEELGKVEAYLAKWEDIPAQSPVYSRGETLKNPHILAAVVKRMLNSFVPWQVSDKKDDFVDAVLEKFDRKSGVYQRLQAALREYARIRADLLREPGDNDGNELVGIDAEWLKILKLAKRIASTDAPVMIYGETGSGKDKVGRYIHDCSFRRDNQYTVISCGALSESLIISELFGYEEGSFTGAIKGGRRGRLEAASGGTLVLDDVEALPLSAQAALLRFIETGEIQKMGGTRSAKADCRIICTTNKNLLELAQQNSFRTDLYYRLGIFKLEIPPLRQRQDDIALLAVHFLKNMDSKKWNGGLVTISDRAVSKLDRYSWPGNIRELQAVLWRAAVECDNGLIAPEHIHFDSVSSDHSAARNSGYQKMSGLLSGAEGIRHLSKDDICLLCEFFSELGDGSFRNHTFAGRFGISSATARNRLSGLVKAGLLVKRGNKRGTNYILGNYLRELI